MANCWNCGKWMLTGGHWCKKCGAHFCGDCYRKVRGAGQCPSCGKIL